MRVELLVIGTEILSGRTLDTNSQWLAKQLHLLGITVQRITVIPDAIDAIATTIQASCVRGTKILITSGGLGPTYDDLTAEGLARAANVPLEEHEPSLRWITKRYVELHAHGIVGSADLTPARRKMAQLPRGAKALPNSVGTAPGIEFQLGDTLIYCLPGVPVELHTIFTTEVQPRITDLAEEIVMEEVIPVSVPGESIIAPILDKVMAAEDGVYLKSMPNVTQSPEVLCVVITVTARTKAEAQMRLRRTIKRLHHAIKSTAQS